MSVFKKHEPGTFCYAELATNDPRASVEFYTDLFGWSRNDQDMGEYGIYTQYQLKGKVVAGQYKLNAEQEEMNVRPNWGLYVTVNDADASSAKAAELGGKVVVEPRDVMGYGRMSILADPAGSVFCIWEPKNNIGVEIRDEPGTVCWSELLTPDIEQAKAFYGGLFGWEPETTDMGELGEYTLFNRSGGLQAAGMLPIKPEMGHIPAHWLVYFAVDDIDVAHNKAVSLGGKALVGPRVIPDVGRFAVLQDAVGAVFAIYRSLKNN